MGAGLVPCSQVVSRGENEWDLWQPLEMLDSFSRYTGTQSGGYAYFGGTTWYPLGDIDFGNAGTEYFTQNHVFAFLPSYTAEREEFGYGFVKFY